MTVTFGFGTFASFCEEFSGVELRLLWKCMMFQFGSKEHANRLVPRLRIRVTVEFFYRGSSWNLVTNSIGSAFRLGDRMSPIRSGGILPPRNRPCPEYWETFVATKFPEECLQKIAKEAKEIVLWIGSLIERLCYLCVLL